MLTHGSKYYESLLGEANIVANVSPGTNPTITSSVVKIYIARSSLALLTKKNISFILK
jgi:hypothetical protein